MPSEKDGVMIILSSPSGAGKTTLVKKLSEKENFEISISHTTRQPRPNENQNEDYFLFLANGDPKHQLDLIKQANMGSKFIGLDTMDFWINNNINDVKKLLSIIYKISS